MEKLTLNYLAPYLPYKVSVYDEDQETKTDVVVGVFRDCIDFESWSPIFTKIESYKLVLRPLSDLTKPCLEDGKTPIIELAKIGGVDFRRDKFEIKNEILNIACGSNFNSGYLKEFYYNDLTYSFIHEFPRLQSRCKTINQLYLFQKLFEWHFDVFNLIDKGLAVDANTIEL